MNRHERRRAAAMSAFELGKKVARGEASMPPLYYKTCSMMAVAFEAWRKANPARELPAFRLGPKNVGLIAPLDSDFAYSLALNDSAREVLLLFRAAGEAVAEDDRDNTPTVIMMSAVLDVLRVPVTRVSLGELGLTVGGENN